MNRVITIPTLITFVRIIGTVVMFFLEPHLLAFVIVYAISGVSDALDGFIARATHTETRLGTVLDSAADLFFYAVMLLKVFPVLLQELPVWIWCISYTSVFIRICSYILAAIKFKQFSSRHTYLNKLTGFMLFIIPFLLNTSALVPYCSVNCIVAILATVEELLIQILDSDYDLSIKNLYTMLVKQKH